MDEYIKKSDIKYNKAKGGRACDDYAYRYDIEEIPVVVTKPITTCKHCKSYNTSGCSDGFGWCENPVVGKGVWDDFYCADGKEKDDV